MATVARVCNRTVVIVGASVLAGIGLTWVWGRLAVKVSRQLAALTSRVEALQREVESLRQTLDLLLQQNPSSSNTFYSAASKPGFYSVHASSGEEDDDFEEAYGGGSDFDSLRSTDSSEYVSLTSESGKSSTEGLFRQVDKMLDSSDHDKEMAFSLLKSRQLLYGKNSDFMWRFAKATFCMSQIEGSNGNEERKKELVYSAKDLAEKALEIDEQNPSIHKWYAISLGSVGDYESTQVKIQNGYKFKDHIEKAIQLKEDDPSSHYLLGRWCYGVYMLSWIERQVAATLFATPPSASVDEALKHFMQAEKLDPGSWKENMLYIAKCLIEKRDYYSAVTWLDKANALPTVSQDDRESQQEIESLMYTYSGYRR